MQVKYAIITPYYREDKSLLRRCIDSVKSQTTPSDHFLVADGYPQQWIDGESVRHIKLDRSHADFGNTPRGVGALIAIAEEYEGIGLLDADNWLDRDHVEVCLQAASGGGRAGGHVTTLLQSGGFADRMKRSCLCQTIRVM